MVPYLAKSVDPHADLHQWTITLRDGIKFHDGTPLTADAVKQNIEAWRSRAALQLDLQGHHRRHGEPIRSRSPSPCPPVGRVRQLPLPRRPRGHRGARRSSPTPSTCNSNLIGTGPFKLDHWTVNQELVVNKNPDYWQKDSKGKQLPYLDKITFKPIAEASQRVNSLEGGQLDVMHTSDGQQVDALSWRRPSSTS